METAQREELERTTPTSNSIPVIEARGTYREVGLQIGSQCRPQIQEMLAGLQKNLPIGATWDAMLNHSKVYLAHSRAIYPQYVEEFGPEASTIGPPEGMLDE